MKKPKCTTQDMRRFYELGHSLPKLWKQALTHDGLPVKTSRLGNVNFSKKNPFIKKYVKNDKQFRKILKKCR